jgi:hypothetical protein
MKPFFTFWASAQVQPLRGTRAENSAAQENITAIFAYKAAAEQAHAHPGAQRMIWKYVIAWIPMVFIAVANGMLREFGYGKQMSELRAHQLSSVTGIAFLAGYIWLVSLRWPIRSSGQAFAIGLIWLTLTVVFEFTFGHYVAKHSWSRLLHDYNIFAGRLWALVLMAVAISPYVIFRIRSSGTAGSD